jgi:lysophospholipase L1-like esterase
MFPAFFTCGSSFLAAAALLSCPIAAAADLMLDFTPGKPHAGWAKVTPATIHGKESRFGYLPGAVPQAGKPGIFAVDADEGNYQVTIRFGDPKASTSTTIKAESRRLMVEAVETEPGDHVTRTFVVNVRKPAIRGGGVTRLNRRESGPPASPDWDDRLTIEINGKRPGIVSMEIKPVEKILTVFLAGDSTVTDQVNEPWAGWGQMLPRFLGPDVAVSNQAESGLALQSFDSQKRLEKILSMMKPGDYLFIQFGHNDQKDKREGAGPFTTYKQELGAFVRAARDKGGIPVLVTPMERRRFSRDGKPETTLEDHAKAVRQVGDEMDVPVIDLHAMSLELYAALGPEGTKKAFVFYAAGSLPGTDQELKDNTHHNNYGGYELARCVVEGIKLKVPALAKHLATDVGDFNPAKPDSPAKFDLPISPLNASERPAGN